MPLIDSDMILAYIKKDDRHSESAEKLFGKIIAGELEVYVSSSMLVEIAFVLKRNNQLDLLSNVIKLIQSRFCSIKVKKLSSHLFS